MKQKQKDRLWTKNFILISLINFMLFLSSNMVNPVMSKYIVNSDHSIGIAGTIVGSYAIAALLIHPFCGILLDKWNKKGLFMAALILMLTAICGYGISTGIGMLFLCRIIHGGAFAMTSTAIMAILADNVADSRMGEGVGYFGLTTVVVTSFAPSLGIYLGNSYGYVYSFYCAAGAVASAFLMILFVGQSGKTSNSEIDKTVKKEKTVEQTERMSVKTIWSKLLAKEVLVLSLIASLFSFANGIESSFVVLYGDSKGIANVGTYFTVSAVAVLLARVFSGKIYDKKGLPYVIVPALLIAAAGMFSLACASGIALFWVGAFFKGYGQGSGQPAMQTKALQLAGPDRRGVASSTYYLFPDIMQSAGPAVGGWIISGFGYQSIFVVSGILLLCGIGIYYVYSRYMRRKNVLL